MFSQCLFSAADARPAVGQLLQSHGKSAELFLIVLQLLFRQVQLLRCQLLQQSTSLAELFCQLCELQLIRLKLSLLLQSQLRLPLQFNLSLPQLFLDERQLLPTACQILQSLQPDFGLCRQRPQCRKFLQFRQQSLLFRLLLLQGVSCLLQNCCGLCVCRCGQLQFLNRKIQQRLLQPQFRIQRHCRIDVRLQIRVSLQQRLYCQLSRRGSLLSG